MKDEKIMKSGKYKIVPPPVDDAAIQRQYATAARVRQARRVTLGRGLPPSPELYFYKGDPENGLAWEWSGENPAGWDIMLAVDEAGEVFESVIQLPGTDRAYGWDGETAANGVYQLVGHDAGGAALFASKAVPKTPVKLAVYCDYGFRWHWAYKDPVQWEVYVTANGATALLGTVAGSARGLPCNTLVTGAEYHVIGTDGNGQMKVRPSGKVVPLCMAPDLTAEQSDEFAWVWTGLIDPDHWEISESTDDGGNYSAWETIPGANRHLTKEQNLSALYTIVGKFADGRRATLPSGPTPGGG